MYGGTFNAVMKKLIFSAIGLICLYGYSPDAVAQKVGLLMHSHVDDRWMMDQTYISDKIEELGGEIMIEIAQDDPKKQIAQAMKLLESGVKSIIVVAVDAQMAVEIVDKAMDYGVKVVCYDRLIKSPNVAAYVTYDNLKVGRLQASSAANKTKGNYILINGPVSDNNAVQFRNGQLEVLQPLMDKGEVTIKEDLVLDNWGEVNAFVSLLSIFTDIQDVDAILAANDGIALAVTAAVDDVEVLKDIYLTGQDADLSSIKNIMKGYQDMTVYKPIAPLAVKAATIAMDLAKGKAVKLEKMEVSGMMIPSVLLDPRVVDAANIKETVVADGHVKMSEVLDN